MTSLNSTLIIRINILQEDPLEIYYVIITIRFLMRNYLYFITSKNQS
jgi:hypothetical protein